MALGFPFWGVWLRAIAAAVGTCAFLFVGLGAAMACADAYVCAPGDPFRHTADSANFTNLYLYPVPDQENWDQYTAETLKQGPGSSPMTADAIDGFTAALTQDSTYFFAATQYHRIDIPRFSGRQKTVQSCVDPVVAFARANGNVLSREILADFVGCERERSGNPSDQVNVIMSPEYRATNDAHVQILGVTLSLSTQPATCPPVSSTNAFHSWQFGTANFTVVPTLCNTSMDALARAMSHEMVELISDPAGFGYVHVDGGGDQVLAIVAGNNGFLNTGELGDICEPGGLKNLANDANLGFVTMPHSSVRVARYWSNQDNDCEPRFVLASDSALVEDRQPHRLGSGEGMTSDLSYRGPFLHGQPEQFVDGIVFYAETTDDNLCHQSSLDLRVDLTDGRPPLTFQHVNRVQNASSWDNGEQHAVNLPMPPGLTLRDVADLGVRVSSGHCHDLFTDGDDGWNVGRIAFYAALRSPPPPPPPPIFPPDTPAHCTVSGGSAECGFVSFNCNRFIAFDEILISASSDFHIKVVNSEPSIGLINAEYSGEGQATLRICARHDGLTACGDPIPDVSFGAVLAPACFGAPPTHVCQTGFVQCMGGCRPIGDPECHLP